MCEDSLSPLLLLELIGQFQLILLRAGQHGFDLLEVALVLCDVLRTAGGRSHVNNGRRDASFFVAVWGFVPACAAP